MGRDTLQVWARSSTTYIYRNSKNTHFITKKATDQSNNLFRRHAIDVTNNRGVVNQQGHFDISVDTSRFCNQPEKINAESSTKNRISGPGNRLSCNEIITTSEEGGGNRSDVSKCIKQQDNFEGIDPVDWEVDFNNTGNLASQTPDSIFATDTNKSPKEKSCIQVFDYSGSAGKGRALMVDGKHENVQWEVSISSSTRYNNIFRCIQTRLGGNISGNFHMGAMVSYRENVTLYVLELEAVRLAILSYTRFQEVS